MGPRPPILTVVVVDQLLHPALQDRLDVRIRPRRIAPHSVLDGLLDELASVFRRREEVLIEAVLVVVRVMAKRHAEPPVEPHREVPAFETSRDELLELGLEPSL